MDPTSATSIVLIHTRLQSFLKELRSIADEAGAGWHQFSDYDAAMVAINSLSCSVVLFEIEKDAGLQSFIKNTNQHHPLHILIGISFRGPDQPLITECYRNGMHDHIPLQHKDHQATIRIRNYLHLSKNIAGKAPAPFPLEHNDLCYDELAALLKKRTGQLSRELENNLLRQVEIQTTMQTGSRSLREWNCLVQLSNLSIREDISPDHFLEKCAPIIRSGFPMPDDTQIVITWNSKKYKSKNAGNTRPSIKKMIKGKEGNIGSLEIWLEEEPLDKEEFQAAKNFTVLIIRFLGQFIEQKENEHWLKRYQKVIEQNPLAVIVTNEKGEIEYVNPSFTKTLGYDFDDVKGKRLDIAFFDNKHEEAYQQLKMRVSSGHRWHSEVKVTKADGTRIWTNSFISPIVEKNRIVGFAGLLEDISDRKKLESRYQEKMEQYIKLADNINAGLGIYTKEGVCKYVNQMGLVNTKMQAEEILNKSVHESFPHELAGRLQNMIDEALQTGETFRVSNEVKLENHQFFAETTVSPLFDDAGNISDIMFLSYDVTAYREVQNSLLIQRKISQLSIQSLTLEQLFERIFEALLEIRWVDCGGIYLYDEEEKLLKLEYQRNLTKEFIKKTSEYTEDTPQFQLVAASKPSFQASEHAQSEIRESIEKEGIRFIAIIPLSLDDQLIGCLNLGSFKRFEISENNKISVESIANVIANVIVKNRAYNLLKESNMLLEKTLDELHGKQQLLIQKSKLESLGELSSGIAHEVNQPLSIIAMAIENMKIKWEAGDVSTQYMNVKFEQIFEYIEKIREIINHIRVFSRDQNSVRYDRIDVENAIRKAIGIVHEQYRNSNILIVIRSGKDIGYTVGNETQLEQVFLNLFSNSKYALLHKDRSIGPKEYKKKIEVSITRDDQNIKVDFSDNGSGIPGEVIDNIFNPFFTTKPETMGTGLGLSIVYGIIKEMDGDIQVKSEPGQWTRFVIRLPRFHKKKDKKN